MLTPFSESLPGDVNSPILECHDASQNGRTYFCEKAKNGKEWKVASNKTNDTVLHINTTFRTYSMYSYSTIFLTFLKFESENSILLE